MRLVQLNVVLKKSLAEVVSKSLTRMGFKLMWVGRKNGSDWYGKLRNHMVKAWCRKSIITGSNQSVISM